MDLKFHTTLRPAYEAISASTWTLAAASTLVISLFGSVPSFAFVSMTAASLTMAIWRGLQTKRVWDYKIAMAGTPWSVIDGREVVEYTRQHPESMWMGFGFRWEPSHTQLAYEALRLDTDIIHPPQFYLNMMGAMQNPKDAKGAAWIHGLEPRESIIDVPWAALEGGTALFGTTGAGKSTWYKAMLTQCATRQDAIIVIDPKGDKSLLQTCKDVAAFTGNPKKFIQFHPAFPKTSVRFDPVKNYNRATEVASRVSALTSSESGKDTFTAVTWDAVNVVAAGERFIGYKTQLVTALRHLSHGLDDLLDKALDKFMTERDPQWRASIHGLIEQAKKGRAENPELVAAILYYKREIMGKESGRDVDVIESLIRVYEYPRDWHSKMVATVIPLLTMLNSDELGSLLSPDYDDISDDRPIFDMAKVIDGRYILYVGLDSLTDSEVGSAIASILLSELASEAGARYNYGEADNRIKIQLIVDEADEVVNTPAVQIANKGRGAGISMTVAVQTFAAYCKRFGSEVQARQFLGNFNNLLALRTIDGGSIDYISERIEEAFIKTSSRAHGLTTRTDALGLAYSGSVSESISESKVEKIPKALISKLPDLHYFSIVAGGKIIKGRVPNVEF